MTDGNSSGSGSDGDSKSTDGEKEGKGWVSVGEGKTKKQRLQEKKKKYRERKKAEVMEVENLMNKMKEMASSMMAEAAPRLKMVMEKGGDAQEFLQWLETQTVESVRKNCMTEDDVKWQMDLLRGCGAFNLHSYITTPPPQ